MPVDDFHRFAAPGRGGGKDLELQLQAFGAIARAHAARVEALQVVERDLEFVEIELELVGKHLRDFLERRGEIAVVVQRVDERGHHLPVAKRQVRQHHLLDQVVAQRRGRRLLRIEIVVLGRCAAAPVGVAAAIVGDVGRIGGLGDVERAAFRVVLAGLPVFGLGLGGAFAHRERHLRRRGLVALLLFFLEQRIFLQDALHLRVELERRQLQQPDRLLQLRRQREMLRELELERLFHGGGASGDPRPAGRIAANADAQVRDRGMRARAGNARQGKPFAPLHYRQSRQACRKRGRGPR